MPLYSIVWDYAIWIGIAIAAFIETLANDEQWIKTGLIISGGIILIIASYNLVMKKLV